MLRFSTPVDDRGLDGWENRLPASIGLACPPGRRQGDGGRPALNSYGEYFAEKQDDHRVISDDFWSCRLS